jgi:hypothetical protein
MNFIVICPILRSCDILNAELTLRIHVSGSAAKTYTFNVYCNIRQNGSDPRVPEVLNENGVAQNESRSNVTPARTGNNTEVMIDFSKPLQNPTKHNGSLIYR